MNYYTWIDGKFYVRPANTHQWKHLSEFPMLEEMERSMNNSRMAELVRSGIPMSGFSEGWVIHQLWLDNPNYQLVRA